MKRTIIAALAALAIATPAVARDLHITYHSPLRGQPNARIIEFQEPLSAEDRAQAAVNDAAWIDYCQPKANVDNFGVTRLTYAKPGCEFGKNH
jgi:hypothetical protein